jgi:hypothetical protein
MAKAWEVIENNGTIDEIDDLEEAFYAGWNSCESNDEDSGRYDFMREQEAENEKLQKENEKLRKCVAMFTDQKSSAFPLGEMMVMHGGNGNGQYICEYKLETIKKARQCLKELEGKI